jgi:hypothetical protein
VYIILLFIRARRKTRDDSYMDRRNLLCLMVLLPCVLALVFVIVALSTNEWISPKYEGIQISFGLWKICINDGCFTVKTVGPLIMTGITAALILISLVIMGTMAVRKSFVEKNYLVLMAFLFISVILMLSTIVTFEVEIAKSLSSLATEMTSIMPSLGEKAIGKTSLDILHTLDAGLCARASNAVQKDSTMDQSGIKNNYGFSSILFISALPLTVVGLVASAYLAGLQQNA